MFETLYDETVTVRRAKARDGRNSVTYEEVLDEGGGQLPVKCRLERRGRRIIDRAGTEIQTDATMMFRPGVKGQAEIRLEDLVVDKRKAAYKVVGLNEQAQLFSGAPSVRADLVLTRQPVPQDANAT